MGISELPLLLLLLLPCCELASLLFVALASYTSFVTALVTLLSDTSLYCPLPRPALATFSCASSWQTGKAGAGFVIPGSDDTHK